MIFAMPCPNSPRSLVWTRVVVYLLALSVLAACTRADMLRSYLASHQEELTRPHSVDGTPVRFVVAPGTPARTIAEQLETAGLIGDATLFEAYVRLNGLDQRLEAGTFYLNPAMTPVEIAAALQRAQADSITVIIPEGWRLEQTADYLTRTGILDGEPYRRRASTGDLTGMDPTGYDFLRTRPAGVSLEGYLFPAAYELPAENPTAEDLLARQLDAFAAQVWPVYEAARGSGATNLDLYAVLTLASIVEREAVIPEEQPLIAGVYLNRLAAGMRLEADPTVQYAMGYQPDTGQWWKTPVFLEEYSTVDSPYNTYLYHGLPPGPIASPGLSAIQAVLYPVEHDFLYFVAVGDGSGAHV
ncbi:MAG: endolytic transglycosylase MltG, partial [Caldilineae bacterium]